MHKVQHGVFGFMTPAVSTFRMNPAISAWAAVNSRLPQSAERTINELWAHRRGRAAQPQCRVSAIAKGVAVTVERARRRDGVADTIAASPARAVPALSRNNCMNKLRESSRPRRPVVLDQTCFVAVQLLDMHHLSSDARGQSWLSPLR